LRFLRQSHQQMTRINQQSFMNHVPPYRKQFVSD
jgi:hypothetical protein